MDKKKDYLRGYSIFGSNGNLHQIEYAEKSVNNSEPSVGIQFENGVILLSQKNTNKSKLLIDDSIEKSHQINEKIGMVFSGHITDGRILADKLREHITEEKLQYGSITDISEIVYNISEDIQDTIKSTMIRPYGVSLLIGGVDFDNTVQLYKIDPSGAPSAWKGISIGKNCNKIQKYIEDNYTDSMNKNEALDLTIKSLIESTKNNIHAKSLDIVIITNDSYEVLSNSDVNTIIDNLGDNDE